MSGMRSAHGSEIFFCSQDFAVSDDLFLDKVAEGGDPLGLAQFLWIRQKNRHIGGLNFGQDVDESRIIEADIVRQDANAEVLQHPLEHAEIVVHRQQRSHIIGEQVLHEVRSGAHLRGIGVLADQPVFGEVFEPFRFTILVQIGLGCEQLHFHGHQFFADQVRLAGLLHADGHVRFAHGQVQHPFLQHQIDAQIGIELVKLGQTRGEPKGSESNGGGHAQVAKHFFFAVANTG
mmetsp:Transcript_29234/g.56584  ORF Transcript_29234/g.56584 Transcript_29234/m.56584 type:complete len:233 (-) Transcript_29234:1262-1960(-)